MGLLAHFYPPDQVINLKWLGRDTHTHTHTHTHTDTHIHTHRHTYRHTHAHRHTRANTQIQIAEKANSRDKGCGQHSPGLKSPYEP